jgi:hypothetical protein
MSRMDFLSKAAATKSFKNVTPLMGRVYISLDPQIYK